MLWNSQDDGVLWSNVAGIWGRDQASVVPLPLDVYGTGTVGGASHYTEWSYYPEMFDEMLVAIDASAKSGTNPTLDVIYEVSLDAGANAQEHTKATRIEDVGSQLLKLTNIGRYGRFKYIVHGTDSPRYTFSITIQGKKKITLPHRI